MQDFENSFPQELSNFTPPPAETSSLKFSFILESDCTQPMIMYHGISLRCGIPRHRNVSVPPENIQAQLAEYVERMAGTEFDLDRTLEGAAIQHLMLTDGE